MSKKSFLTITDASTVTFDADQSKNFQVTLGGNRSLIIAGGQEGDEIGILLIQGGSGSYTPTWPSNVSFKANQAPNISTTVGAADLITLVKRGSTWSDVSGAPSKLPSRVTDRSLSTIALVGATASLVLNLSGGGGQGTGNLPNAAEVRSNSGSQLLTKIDGSGSVLIGSGKLIVGSILDDASYKLKVLNDGSLTTKAALSGASVTVVASGDDAGKAACWLSTGKLGKCGGADASACTCTAL